MTTLDDILAKATPVERTVRVCVDGATYGEYERVTAELEDIATNPLKTARLASGSDERANFLVTEKERLQGLLSEATYEFKFRAVSPKAWSDLLTSNAKADGNLDMEAFALAAIAATVSEPEGLDNTEALSRLLESLSPAQQAELVDAAWEVNTTVPKGMNYSAA